MDEKFALRAVLRYCWKRGLTPTATIKEMCAAKGEGYVSLSTVKIRFNLFKDGETSLDNEECSG